MTDTEPLGVAPSAAAPPATSEPTHRPVRHVTSVLVGAVVLTWDRVAGPDPEPETAPGRARRLRNMAIGALFGVEDATVDTLSAARRQLGDPRWQYARRAGSAVVQITERFSDLSERGAVEQKRGRDSAISAGQAITRRVVGNPIVNMMVDAQLERTVPVLVGTVLDEVLDRLDAEPERVRELIRGQQKSITDELVDRIRGGAVAGDTTINRVTARLLRRGTPRAATEPAAPRAATEPAASRVATEPAASRVATEPAASRVATEPAATTIPP